MHLKKGLYFSIWDSNIGSGMAKNKITPWLFLILSLLRKKGIQAAAFLGDAFLYGKGVEIDYEKAFQYYLKGANAGDPFAQTGLSVMYLEGYSIPRNLDKAVF